MREGDRFGRYTLVSRLGGGGFASVWLARNANGEELALKILHAHHIGPGRPSSLSAADRFLREARLLMAFSHPGIVRVLEVIDGRPASAIGFAMEYLVGRDLEQLLPTITYLRLLDVIARAADILHDIHLAGVVHRDIKLSNIFVCDEPQRSNKPLSELVKIIDFGIAKDFADASLINGTGHGEFVGTLDTMAPESFRRLESAHVDVTPATDQWGLGVALFHGLTGASPFKAPHILALIPKVLEEPTPAIVLHHRFGLGGCPEELQAIVDRCLAKDPYQRFASAKEIADALRRIAFHHRESISLVAPAIPGASARTLSYPDSTLRDSPAPDAWDMTIRDRPLSELEAKNTLLPEISVRTDEMFATPSVSDETMLDVAAAEMFQDEATGEHDRDELPTKRIGVEANIQEPLLPSVVREMPGRSAHQAIKTASFAEEPTPYATERPSAIVVRAAPLIAQPLVPQSSVPPPLPPRDGEPGSNAAITGNERIVARDPAATPWQGSVLEGQGPAKPIRPDWVMPLPSIVSADPAPERSRPPQIKPASSPNRAPMLLPPDPPARHGLPRWLVVIWLVLGATFAFWLGRRFS